ncbi:MAG: alanine--tRNA ligase [Bacillota bacterium]|nr:alanine--tRNA ligase [Bacillota bacterium]MDD3297624.1 alanine--tRNA ligase [Bacillota bacterium]MDD3850867.1 alanine--tRNA ligase [Bacillota bacterium]MDD4707475.1 alanine--tRNA ligase [Bacillota bacterium]
MEQLGLNEIRERFLKFFESKDHLRLPGFPLVPQDDKSLLLINSGMAPLKPYFTGAKTPPGKRAATCQKCIRTPDIEMVGKTARHGTFFEMLGNFSFGDYFKEEAIAWAWEFVTEDLKLPKDRLWITIYKDDDEAFEIWNKSVGIPAEKIVRMGKEDNFWEIGLGPCGPCSEIYFDRGEKYGCGSEDCRAGCDCDRYVEFWNLVFTQFDRDAKGEYHRLENPNIDTGMGLERMAAIMQGAETIFEVDTIRHILDYIAGITGNEYGKSSKADVSIRVITDHIRGVTNMISDGVIPSNEGRGYVLRRLLRRAARHGKLLGLKGSFLYDVSDKVIEVSGGAYPVLMEKRDYIRNIIKLEEERFQETLDQGLAILQEYVRESKKSGTKVLTGDKAFKLYDTFGFPLDLTRDILEEEDMTVDEEGFEKEMADQRDRARAARADAQTVGWSDEDFSQLEGIAATEFLGYEKCSLKTRVAALLKENTLVDEVFKGDRVALILASTPFYAESGGQVGDRGEIKGEGFEVEVTDCKAVQGDRFLHIGLVKTGVVKAGMEAVAKIDTGRRIDTARNHTATHLLHRALRAVLGGHVEQAGSLVGPDRLRFDFTHIAAVTEEQLKQVEDLVNSKILEGLDVETIVTDIDSARNMGATALFGEKYKDVVRVVKTGDFSLELCGGTHVKNTWALGQFVLLAESGIAAGVRRIEALTGSGALEHIKAREDVLNKVAGLLKTHPENAALKIESLMEDLKTKEREIHFLRQKLAGQETERLIQDAKEVKGLRVITARVDNLDMDALRNLGDSLRDRLSSGVVVLASLKDDKISMLAMATKDAVSAGVHCGSIIKEIAKAAGGGGGGKPDMAQAGAKRPEDISKALGMVIEILQSQLK